MEKQIVGALAATSAQTFEPDVVGKPLLRGQFSLQTHRYCVRQTLTDRSIQYATNTQTLTDRSIQYATNTQTLRHRQYYVQSGCQFLYFQFSALSRN